MQLKNAIRLFLGGPYQNFLSKQLVQNLQKLDLHIALAWAKEHVREYDLPGEYESLPSRILERAFEFIDIPEILDAITGVILRFLKLNKGSIIQHLLTDNEDKRRRVLTKFLEFIAINRDSIKKGTYFYDNYLAFGNDLQWMIEQLDITQLDIVRQVLVDWIYSAFRFSYWRQDLHQPEQVDIIIEACKNHTALKMEFAWLIDPIEIESAEAQKIKSRFYEAPSSSKQSELESKPTNSTPTLQQRINNLLEKFESGHLLAWVLIMNQLASENDNFWRNRLDPDLATLHGWKICDENIKQRIVEAAKIFVLKQELDIDRCLQKDSHYLPMIDGYKALRLLLEREDTFLLQLSKNIWEKWMIAILDYPNSYEDNIVKLAYGFAPIEFLSCLLFLINKKGGYIVSKIEGWCDTRIAAVLVDKLKDTNLPPHSMGALLGYLLRHKVIEAKQFAEKLHVHPLPSETDVRERVAVAAVNLLLYAEDLGWNVVWPLIKKDIEFGREVISAVASRNYHQYKTDIRKRLNEDQLAELYIWLSQVYPHYKDPVHDGCYTVTSEDIAREWRNSTLDHLKMRKTNRACEALHRIMLELPNLYWIIKPVLLETQTLMRLDWQPIKPEYLLRLVNDEQSRLVQDADDLLDVLLESLQRLEKRFQGSDQGEIPAAIDLWNETSSSVLNKAITAKFKKLKKLDPSLESNSSAIDNLFDKDLFTPKDENRLSDYIKEHFDRDLKDRGLIVNREVEFRRSEKTDIRVETFVRNGYGEVADKVIVIIEVKGSWHKDLNEAMQTQLVDTYLKNNLCQHGLYLVGWFYCDGWSDSDYRKANSRRVAGTDQVALQERLNAQAISLSKGISIKACIINVSLHQGSLNKK